MVFHVHNQENSILIQLLRDKFPVKLELRLPKPNRWESQNRYFVRRRKPPPDTLAVSLAVLEFLVPQK